MSKQLANLSDVLKRDLEVNCAISGQDPDSVLTITFRTRIEDITHKLGSIDLPQTPETDEIDIFTWTCQVIENLDTRDQELAVEKHKVEIGQSTIASLRNQLDDLIKAKAEHEENLLAKFAVVLNTKKAKIRNQQRLLQEAKIPKKKLDELRLTIEGDEKASSSTKSGKRGTRKDAAGDEDTDDAFEPMDIDKPDDEEKESERTPSPISDGSETASEDEAAAHISHQAAATPAPRARTNRKKPSPPPPPRQLPFGRQNRQSKPAEPKEVAVPPRVEDDEETASDDDEL